MENYKELNVLNGLKLYKHFKEHATLNRKFIVPFNEAMCVGAVSEDIFSPDFVKCRAISHGLTLTEYTGSTIQPLQPFFDGNFTDLVIWSDDDMLSQMNLLTILAYLDQINYSQKITFNLMSKNYRLVDSFYMDIRGYKEIYKQVFIQKQIPQHIELPAMKNAVKLYFQYLKEENGIKSHINQSGNMSNDFLMKDLNNHYPNYGLGDHQYVEVVSATHTSFQ